VKLEAWQCYQRDELAVDFVAGRALKLRSSIL
jgi:hypothetical protein